MLAITQHLIQILLVLVTTVALEESCTESNQCCKYDECPIENEPSVVLEPYTVGGKNVTIPTYIQPDVSTFYKEEPGSRQAQNPYFPGFAVKFINLSPFVANLYWYPDDGREGILFNNVAPFGSKGTASFPNHKFYINPSISGSNADNTVWFTMNKGQTLYLYDAFELGHAKVEELSEKDYGKYIAHKENLEFAEQYREYTGRDWQSLYPGKKLQHKIWRADYFGQEHWVETKETQFVKLPPESELNPIEKFGIERRLDESEPRLLDAYRQPGQQSLNLTLKVISCAPRAFEIDNFLSEVEVHHILHLATGINLYKSRTGASGEAGKYGEKTKTRTSMNSWVHREKSPIIDAIYRRAADLMRIDEALFRARDEEEMPDYPVKRTTIAENLQLVHYDVGQEYTPHHDFAYPPVDDQFQSTRYATLLLYLNDDMKGGETSFPRYINAETRNELKVTPKLGKAVLFYSYLPDGNLDDYSQHAAKPVIEGEKWLINLWVWDAAFGH